MSNSASINSSDGGSKWRRGLDWGLYDFANSGYFLVYVIFLYPLYLLKGPMAGDPWFEAKWGLAQGLSVLFAVVLGLLLGRRFDEMGLKKVAPLLLLLPAVASFLLPLLVLVNASAYLLLASWILVQSLYLISLTVYDSSLTQVARKGESVAISGWAWGWGYMGGLTCMGLMQVGLIWWGRYSSQDFLVGSIFFAVFSAIAAWRMPALLLESGPLQALPPREDRIDLERWKLLAVFVLIVDGIAIFMAFFGTFAHKVAAVSDDNITYMLALLQLLAFPLTGVVSGFAKYGIARLLKFCGAAWLLAVAISVVVPGATSMWIAVVIVATTVGTTQALLRAIYADSLDPEQAVRGFSIYAVVEKGAAFLGPTLAGLLIVGVGHRIVLAFAGVMTFIGCLVLARLIGMGRSSALAVERASSG